MAVRPGSVAEEDPLLGMDGALGAKHSRRTSQRLKLLSIMSMMMEINLEDSFKLLWRMY